MAEMREMAVSLSRSHVIPVIEEFFIPDPFEPGAHGRAEFLVMLLSGGAAGISYLLLPESHREEYRALRPGSIAGRPPADILRDYSGDGPVDAMISLAAVNAVCQHVMRTSPAPLDHATDSLGLMNIRDGDRVGMVGFFAPLMKYLHAVKAELVIIEKDKTLMKKNPGLPITMDPSELRGCTKVLCTSTTVLNNSLDEILGHCAGADHITVLGPTAGFYPDPLFRRGIHVLGGRYVSDGALLMSRIRKGERWGDATKKLCFVKDTYRSIL